MVRGCVHAEGVTLSHEGPVCSPAPVPTGLHLSLEMPHGPEKLFPFRRRATVGKTQVHSSALLQPAPCPRPPHSQSLPPRLEQGKQVTGAILEGETLHEPGQVALAEGGRDRKEPEDRIQ